MSTAVIPLPPRPDFVRRFLRLAHHLVRRLASGPGKDPRPALRAVTRWAVLGALFFALTVAVLGGTVTSSFLADDFGVVESIQRDGPLHRWCSKGEPFFRPLTTSLYWLDLQLWGLDPRGFHLTNLLLHAAVSLLVVAVGSRVARRITGLPERRRWELGLTAGLLFLLHPVHSEPVAWISGRADLLASAFCLLALVFHGMAGGRADPRGRFTRTARIASLSSFALALAAKEAAVVLPFLVLALELAGGPREEKGEESSRWGRTAGALRASAPFLLMLPLYIGVRWLVLGQLVGGYGLRVHLRANPVVLLDLAFAKASRAFIPRLDGRQLPPGTVVMAAAIVFLVMWWLYRGRRSKHGEDLKRVVALGGVLFFIAVLPVLNLTVSVSTSSAERVLYLPSVFAMLVAAGLAQLAFPVQGLRWSAVAVSGLALAVLTIGAVQPWRYAARLSEDLTQAVSEHKTRGDIYVIGVPEDVAGAFALRGGLHASLRFAGFHGSRVIIVNRVSLPSPTSRLEVERSGTLFTIETADNQKAFRLRRHVTRNTEKQELVQVQEFGRRRMQVDLPGLRPRDRVIAFTGGEALLLHPAGEPKGEMVLGEGLRGREPDGSAPG